MKYQEISGKHTKNSVRDDQWCGSTLNDEYTY